MHAHTHLYCTKKITGSNSPLLLYGCILPDIAVTGLGSWKGISQKAEDFFVWLQKNHPDFTELGLGMMLHEIPCGIDRLAHSSYKGGKGYAFALGEDLIDEVHDACKSPMPFSEVFAHTFIELAVEFLVLKKQPELENELKNVIGNTNLDKVAESFSEFYNKDLINTRKCIEEYNKLLLADNRTIEGLAEIVAHMVKQVCDANIDLDKTKALIILCVERVKGNYEEFLNDAIECCKRDVKKFS